MNFKNFLTILIEEALGELKREEIGEQGWRLWKGIVESTLRLHPNPTFLEHFQVVVNSKKEWTDMMKAALRYLIGIEDVV